MNSKIQYEWELMTDGDIDDPSPYCYWCSPWPDRGGKPERSKPFALRVPNHFREQFVERIDETADWLGIVALGEGTCRECGKKSRGRAWPPHRLLAIYFSLGCVLEDPETRNLFPRTLHPQTVRRILDLRRQGIPVWDVAERLNRQEGRPPRLGGRWDGNIIDGIERYVAENADE